MKLSNLHSLLYGSIALIFAFLFILELIQGWRYFWLAFNGGTAIVWTCIALFEWRIRDD